ncbi:uncharacterized protein LOC131928184 [Physella acuta]|uniref:uncharacterized protein LOC131928184 n=1 Tax=Physella acuta TaxID=109671 RepID=UPI0027DDA728|nr:uncharacterized protein LOC131928184 [Physella acuta]
MNSNENNNSENYSEYFSNTKEFLVSDENLRCFRIAVTIFLRGILYFCGIITNFFNVVIFRRLGLNNSMKVAIFVTSLGDVAISVLLFAASICHLLSELEPENEFDLNGFSFYVLEDTSYVLYLASCWVTAYMSVEKCCCVLFPFKVKVIFTTRRSVVAMVIVYGVAITTNLHVLYGIRKIVPEVEANSASTGRSQWTLVYSDVTESIVWLVIKYIFSGLVLFVISQVVMILSSILMVYGLRQSSKVRGNQFEHSLISLTQEKINPDNAISVLSHSERKLVKIVLMLSIMMIVCNMPRLIAFMIYYIVGEAEYITYQNLNTLT